MIKSSKADLKGKNATFEDREGCIVMTLDDIVIDEESILRIQGYRHQKQIRRAIRQAAISAARETETLITPRIYFRVLDIRDCHDHTLELEDGTVFQNEAFQKFLKNPRRVTVFILTMGSALDNAVKDYIANDQLLNALFLETAGWLGIEAATRTFSFHLQSRAREEGYRLSPRLGPGYSYKLDGRSVLWPLEQQQTLFKLFAGDAIDVELLDSCVMMPKISRSGIFGFIDKA